MPRPSLCWKSLRRVNPMMSWLRRSHTPIRAVRIPLGSRLERTRRCDSSSSRPRPPSRDTTTSNRSSTQLRQHTQHPSLSQDLLPRSSKSPRETARARLARPRKKLSQSATLSLSLKSTLSETTQGREELRDRNSSPFLAARNHLEAISSSGNAHARCLRIEKSIRIYARVRSRGRARLRSETRRADQRSDESGCPYLKSGRILQRNWCSSANNPHTPSAAVQCSMFRLACRPRRVATPAPR